MYILSLLQQQYLSESKVATVPFKYDSPEIRQTLNVSQYFRGNINPATISVNGLHTHNSNIWTNTTITRIIYIHGYTQWPCPPDSTQPCRSPVHTFEGSESPVPNSPPPTARLIPVETSTLPGMVYHTMSRMYSPPLCNIRSIYARSASVGNDTVTNAAFTTG